MAALPYLQLYVSDYLADTMHLTTEEHGAYLLIIMNYWQTGKSIEKRKLQNIARLSDDRWQSVESSLSEFFIEEDGRWHHKRIDADIQAVIESQNQRILAGKASAEARKRHRQGELKNNSTTVQRPFNDRSTTVDVPLQRDGNDEKRIDTDKKDSQPMPDKSGPVLLRTYIAKQKADGKKAIREEDPIFDYADSVKLPHEFLVLAWRVFVARHSEGDRARKKQRDWPATFRNAVKDNWYKLWWLGEAGEYQLTTTGRQAQMEHGK